MTYYVKHNDLKQHPMPEWTGESVKFVWSDTLGEYLPVGNITLFFELFNKFGDIVIYHIKIWGNLDNFSRIYLGSDGVKTVEDYVLELPENCRFDAHWPCVDWVKYMEENFRVVVLDWVTHVFKPTGR